MKLITKKQLLENSRFYLNEILDGKIFIYPTDTIYGIGCIATNSESIKKIREIKQRDKKPFSIIVPNKKWIQDNCLANHEEFLEKLPGKFTFIFKLINQEAVNKKELIGDLEAIGVRIPNHWFAEFLSLNNITFVTTSANISGQPAIKEISELDGEIKQKVDYIIDEGILDNSPSEIYNLSGDTPIKLR